MNGQKRRNAFGNKWTAIATVFGLLCLNGIVSARPADDRGARENRAAVGNDPPPLDLANTQEKDLIDRADEESLEVLKERYKRFSDQRRAELETLIILSEMTGKLVNVIRGVRHLRTIKFDRNKRAVFDLNMKNLQKLFRLSAKLGLKGNAAYPVIS